MIAEGLKVVCVQRVDEGHIVESALGRPARRPKAPEGFWKFGGSREICTTFQRHILP
jgi:hypothetical protein